jgi:hypothetical protein
MKTVQFNIRLEPDDADLIAKVAATSGLMKSAVIAMLLRAACDCLKREQGNLPFPLGFDIRREGDPFRSQPGRLAPSKKA